MRLIPSRSSSGRGRPPEGGGSTSCALPPSMPALAPLKDPCAPAPAWKGEAAAAAVVATGAPAAMAERLAAADMAVHAAQAVHCVAAAAQKAAAAFGLLPSLQPPPSPRRSSAPSRPLVSAFVTTGGGGDDMNDRPRGLATKMESCNSQRYFAETFTTSRKTQDTAKHALHARVALFVFEPACKSKPHR